MRLLVTGGRDFQDRGRLWKNLDTIDAGHCIDLIIEGGAPGADRLAREWAIRFGCCFWTFEARWDDVTHPQARIRRTKQGKPYDADAGPRRNQAMIDIGQPTHALAAPGGHGTDDMIRRIRRAGVELFDWS